MFRFQFQKLFKNYAKDHKKFWTYIWGEKNENLWKTENNNIDCAEMDDFINDAGKAVLKYRFFYKLQNQFRWLMYKRYLPPFKKWGRAKNEPENSIGRWLVRGEWINNKIGFRDFSNLNEYEFDSNFKVKVLYDEFSQAIDGINIIRVRCCVRLECQKIFWASKIGKAYDPKCCSPKCANLFFAQKSMDKTKNERKRQRRDGAVKKLQKRFKGTDQWTENATLIVPDDNGNTEATLNLSKGTQLRIVGIDFDEIKKGMPIRFFVEMESGKKGQIEIEYGNQFSTNLKRTFDLVD